MIKLIEKHYKWFDKSTTMFSKMKWRLTGWNGTKEKILVQRRHPHALYSLYQSDSDDNSLHSMWQHFKRFCRCWYEHDRVGNTGKIRRTMDANGARDSGTETWQEISVCRLTSFPNRKKRLYAEERSVKEHVESICEKGKISRWHVKKRWNKLPSRVVFPQRVLSFSMLRWTETQGLPKICEDSCQWYGICFVGETRSWSLSIVE